MPDYIVYIIEFKKRVTRCVLAYLLVASPLIIYARETYHWFAAPLLKILPAHSSLIATDITSPFMVPIKLALFISLFIIIPYIFVQLWGFISPALYPHEKKPLKPILFFSISLFYVGIFFAYALVCPLALQFFISMAPEGVMVMTDMGHYLDFVLKLMLAFGFAFQIPIILLCLVYSGITTAEHLIAKRPYMIVGSFIIGMILTPPDVVSQILLAVPLCGLCEIGLLLAKRLSGHSDRRINQSS